ncbi:lipase 3-like [Macrobrachium nipponense]|uniref:lipase 3-like n=1 Tax=Macrobrachium nipponense TaxID=159736 RepID=UPI0030C7FCBC
MHYGQREPPLYNLAKVTAPVGLFWGNTDWLADPTDVARLAADLPNLVLNYNVPKEEFNHLDFGWGIHANEYVYTKVLELFAAY